MNPNLELKFLSVLSGDAIILRFLGNDNTYHNVLIDGGYVRTYQSVLKPELIKIRNRNEKIDLLIISHYDGDHIGGIISFIHDKDFDVKSFVDCWWANVDLPILNKNGLISINQINTLNAYLKTIKKQLHPILENKVSCLFYGLSITILSPDRVGYANSKKKIELHNTKISTKQSDHNTKLEDFSIDDCTEDNSPANGGSIAFLAEIYNKSFLLLADSFPSTICHSLKELGYSSINKLHIDIIKVSHHGSKFNISNEFIEMVECENYVISVNGVNRDNLPNKETLAKILLHKGRDKHKGIIFYFTNQDKVLDNIFDTDGKGVFDKYNFQVKFPETQKAGITI